MKACDVIARLFGAFLFASVCALVSAADKPDGPLVSGEYYVRQTWSQEKDYDRHYLVNVPANPEKRRLPVVIFLHGNGSSARSSADVFRRFPGVMKSYVTVVADGYLKGWNTTGEKSKADDLGFIEAIIRRLAAFDNIQKDGFTVMGVSNGSALVNQLAIESRLPNIRSYVAIVSPLNTLQHDGSHFKAKGPDNNYRALAIPRTGVRILNLSGTEDRLIPYEGGVSPIPVNNGKLSFVPAETSVYLWAKAMGYAGTQLQAPTRIEGQLEVFSYLNGDVVHYKANRRGHDAFDALDEPLLLGFLKGNLPTR